MSGDALQVEPEAANASALIYNDRGEYLLHLRDYFPGQIWEPGMWSLLGGGREPQDATLEHTVRRELAEEAGLDLADLSPFATEYASHDDGTTVPIAVYAGRWNGDPRELRLTEGVMLAWFTPDDLHRLRIADTTSALVRRHAAGLPRMQSGPAPAPAEHRPASPHGTVPHIIGVHLYLERPDGTVLLGLRHPDSAFAPSTWHVLAGHCEQENAIDCLIREAREEAGLRIERRDVELVQVQRGPGPARSLRPRYRDRGPGRDPPGRAQGTRHRTRRQHRHAGQHRSRSPGCRLPRGARRDSVRRPLQPHGHVSGTGPSRLLPLLLPGRAAGGDVGPARLKGGCRVPGACHRRPSHFLVPRVGSAARRPGDRDPGRQHVAGHHRAHPARDRPGLCLPRPATAVHVVPGRCGEPSGVDVRSAGRRGPGARVRGTPRRRTRSRLPRRPP
ncbi:NUDIX domain-containing protein [Streptomyces rochei]|uniref:NUDIX domain-containing protein n=1 Tax=Streptomyces rochei TaxID=1928 RepID=UPI0036274E6B